MTFKVQDHYFKKAKKENFLARSVYKLEEIDQKCKVLRIGDKVLDLGYYPGSWVQYTSPKVGEQGRVVAIDIKDVNTSLRFPNLTLFQKDILQVKDLSELGVDRPFDVVLSDMAPNTSGIKSLDQDRSLILVEMVFSLLPQFLRRGGNLVVKIFESNDAQIFLRAQKKRFEDFRYVKPKSTRSVSKEFFVVGKGFQEL